MECWSVDFISKHPFLQYSTAPKLHHSKPTSTASFSCISPAFLLIYVIQILPFLTHQNMLFSTVEEQLNR